MEQFLGEAKVLKTVVAPVNLNTATNTGARVSMKNAKRVSFIVGLGAATSATSHLFILKQHDAASAGNTKDLSSDNPIFHKVGAATVATKLEVSTAVASNDLHTLLGDNAGIVVFEVLAEQLDVANDYAWVSLVINQPGVTQLGYVVAEVDHHIKPAYDQAV